MTDAHARKPSSLEYFLFNSATAQKSTESSLRADLIPVCPGAVYSVGRAPGTPPPGDGNGLRWWVGPCGNGDQGFSSAGTDGPGGDEPSTLDDVQDRMQIDGGAGMVGDEPDLVAGPDVARAGRQVDHAVFLR